EWLHAVLVRDAAAVDAIRRWHEQAQPGPLVLLPSVPGPRLAADGHPLKDDLRVDGPAATWVRALLAGHEGLAGGENGGRARRRAARVAEVEARLEAVHADLERHEVERVRLDERLGRERAQLVDLEAQQEAAREQRVRWQVDAAQVEARLGAARERAGRAAAEV